MSEDQHKEQSEKAALDRINEMRKTEPGLEEWALQIISGDRLSLARGITLLESRKPTDQDKAADLLKILIPKSGKSRRIGITGVPGVGKSSLIEVIGLKLIERGHKVAVLAIDPSSKLSSGSILGDKTRMSALASSSSAFVRPTPAADALGGVARMTRETMILCEAAGFDIVIIETVGVGQSETEVQGMVDTFLLLMLAGAGDELQGIKRGIMEMADVIAVTKADGDNISRAQQARTSISSAIHLFAANAENWTVPVITCSSQNDYNIDDLLSKLETHHTYLASSDLLNERRKQQDLSWFRNSLNDQILLQFYQNKAVQSTIQEMELSISNKEISPFTAAQTLLKIANNLIYKL